MYYLHPTLYLQCSSGISGDMFLALLSDLGTDFSPLNAILEKSPFSVRILTRRMVKEGLKGTIAEVVSKGGEVFRSLAEIEDLIDGLSLSSRVKSYSKKAFKTLARIEAECHGIGVEEVHFHELGAIDTIVDIVGAFWGVESLGIEGVVCSPLPWFEGEVECAHGRLPLPAPATLRLLKGKPIYSTSIKGEIITPTGALLLDMLVDEFKWGFDGRILRSGMGWGHNKIEGVNLNALRGVLFCRKEEDTSIEEVCVLETNIDHLSGEEMGYLFEVLFEYGALDVVYLPAVMKKNRPGGILQVMCHLPQREKLLQQIFTHTHSLGIRSSFVSRVVVDRRNKRISTPLGEVEVKEYHIGGKVFFRIEYNSIRRIARERDISFFEVKRLLEPFVLEKIKR